MTWEASIKKHNSIAKTYLRSKNISNALALAQFAKPSTTSNRTVSANRTAAYFTQGFQLRALRMFSMQRHALASSMARKSDFRMDSAAQGAKKAHLNDFQLARGLSFFRAHGKLDESFKENGYANESIGSLKNSHWLQNIRSYSKIAPYQAGVAGNEILPRSAFAARDSFRSTRTSKAASAENDILIASKRLPSSDILRPERTARIARSGEIKSGEIRSGAQFRRYEAQTSSKSAAIDAKSFPIKSRRTAENAAGSVLNERKVYALQRASTVEKVLRINRESNHARTRSESRMVEGYSRRNKALLNQNASAIKQMLPQGLEENASERRFERSNFQGLTGILRRYSNSQYINNIQKNNVQAAETKRHALRSAFANSSLKNTRMSVTASQISAKNHGIAPITELRDIREGLNIGGDNAVRIPRLKRSAEINLKNNINVTGNSFTSKHEIDPNALADMLGRIISEEIESSASGIYA